MINMKHLQLLIKPASSDCNLRCHYCFYLDESSNRDVPSYGHMSEETTRILIDKALSAAEERCTFGFQGGEPTLAGLSYFESFTALVDKINSQKQKKSVDVRYVLQTNAVILDERWIEFLKKHHFLVGVSIDGVKTVNDKNRKDMNGQGTFQQVLKNVHRLQECKVDVNVLCVLNAQSVERIEAAYHFFKKEGLFYQQYIPCLDPLEENRGQREWSLTPELYADALRKLFDLWFSDIIQGTPVSIREFDNWLMMLQGRSPTACAWMGKCSMQNVIEADGSIYPCDFYALDNYRLANVKDERFEFSNQWEKSLFFQEQGKRRGACQKCRWYPLCRGGCARDYVRHPDGDYNYFCKAYQDFFAYVIERLEWLVPRVSL